MPLLVYLGVKSKLGDEIEPAGEPKARGSASLHWLKKYPRDYGIRAIRLSNRECGTKSNEKRRAQSGVASASFSFVRNIQPVQYPLDRPKLEADAIRPASMTVEFFSRACLDGPV